MSESRFLWEIENLEEKKAIKEKQLKTIPEAKELKRLKEEIEGRQEEIRKLREELGWLVKDLKSKEDSLAVLMQKIQKAGLELYSGAINSPKELETAQKNIDIAKEKAAETEESILVLMDKIDNGEETVRRLLQQLEQAKGEFRCLKEAYDKRKSDLTVELNEITQRLEEMEKKIPPDRFKKYQELRRRYDDHRGIALLQKGICTGCHMTVSFDIIKLSKNRDQDIFCDNCGRMLLVD